MLTPFIGRTYELATLHALVAYVEEGRGQVVGIIGEPGMGKTRLCAEFIRSQLPQPWCMLDTRAVSYDQAIPYGPIIALLKDYFQLDERDPAPAIRDQVTARLLALDRALTPMVPAILVLLDVPVEDPQWQALDPPQRRQQTFQAIKHLLFCASQMQPLLVVMENLHWLDTETQACLDTLIESLPTARLLLLVTYRPEYQHGWGSKTYYTQVRLDALSPAQADAFLQALLGSDHGLTPLKHLLITRTAGNPFFLEESVQTLVESGALTGHREPIGWRSPCQPSRYRRRCRRCWRPASTGSRPRTSGAPDRGGHRHGGALRRCCRPSPTCPRRRSTAASPICKRPSCCTRRASCPTLAYTFKHALTHEVAYGSLLPERGGGCSMPGSSRRLRRSPEIA